MEITAAGAGVAFAAGLLSFLSPCVLPLVPAYVTFVTGMSLDELRSDEAARRRWTVMAHATLFVVGFSIVFVLMGASATFLGSLIGYYRRWVEIGGGIMLVAFGLLLLGIFRLPGAEREWRFHLSDRPVGYLGSLLIGITFGAGWTPCIGPVLGGILTLAATHEGVTQGMTLLGVYSLGLAIPFLFAAVALDRFLAGYGRIRRWLPWVSRASGVLLIAVGILLLTGMFTILAEIMAGWTPDFILERI